MSAKLPIIKEPTRQSCALSPCPAGGYGVHTSREIPPNTWFRPLAL
ncbi:hypothetical protein [Nostoc sp. 'Peltigera malacea cyanobiont' DB3992]|nr:hypothetical protein [Nostoc sp. 'Peltigera malacea cyanobiont' DB3992]